VSLIDLYDMILKLNLFVAVKYQRRLMHGEESCGLKIREKLQKASRTQLSAQSYLKKGGKRRSHARQLVLQVRTEIPVSFMWVLGTRLFCD
jgi:hypothetical protein